MLIYIRTCGRGWSGHWCGWRDAYDLFILFRGHGDADADMFNACIYTFTRTCSEYPILIWMDGLVVR